jgi:cell division protease FtsH
MVTAYGMSENLGPLALGTRDSGQGETRTYSERVAEAIDAEVRALITAAMAQAEAILLRHRDVLDRLAARLLDVETVEGEELEAVFTGASGDGEGVVTPLPRYRHRASGQNIMPLPRLAAGLASTMLPEG